MTPKKNPELAAPVRMHAQGHGKNELPLSIVELDFPSIERGEIMKAKRKFPHDHGHEAMSKTGSIFIGQNGKGERILMCLECHTTWSIPNGKAPTGFWVCPHGCNEILGKGIKDNCDSRIFDAIRNLLSWQLHQDRRVNEAIDVADTQFNASLCATGNPWREALARLWWIATDINPNSLTLNTIRNYIAQLWGWFESWEEYEQGDGLEWQIGYLKSIDIDESPLFDLAEAKNNTEGMVNLTKTWRKFGGGPIQAPLQWLNHEDNAEFIRLVKEEHGSDDCIKSKAGDLWAHPLIGMKYTEDLSPEFRAWCLDRTVEILKGVNAPAR